MEAITEIWCSVCGSVMGVFYNQPDRAHDHKPYYSVTPCRHCLHMLKEDMARISRASSE